MKATKSRLRKGISVILAATMALSACAVGFTAFAGDQNVEQQIQGATELTDTLEGAYNALTESEKDAMSGSTQSKLMKMAYDKYKKNDEGASLSYADVVNNIKAHMPYTVGQQKAFDLALAVTGKGPFTATDGTIYSYDVMTKLVAANFKGDVTYTGGKLTLEEAKKVANDVISQYNALTDAQKQILYFSTTGYSTSTSYTVGPYAYVNYSYSNTTTTNTFWKMALSLVTVENASADAATMQTAFLTKVNLPNHKDFAAIDLLTIEIPEFYTANKAFDKEKATIDEIIEYVDLCEKLLSIYSNKTSLYAILYASPKFINNDDTLISPNDAYKAAKAAAEALYLTVFVDMIKGIVIPEKASAEFNETIIDANELYKKIPYADKKNVPEETLAKYEKILSLSYYAPQATTHTGFETAKVEAPKDVVSDVLTETLVPGLDDTINKLVGGFLPGATLADVASGALFTNEMVTVAVKAIFPMLYDALAGMDAADMFTLMPDAVAKSAVLSNKKFNGQLDEAKAELLKYANWADVPNNINWNVIPGDLTTFCNALLGSLDALTVGLGGMVVVRAALKEIVLGTQAQNTFKTAFDYIADGGRLGLYERVILPLFEMLGATDYMSANEYLAYVNGVNDQAISTYLSPVVDVLYNQILTPLMKNPVDYLSTHLPTLVYHLEDGCIFQGLEDTVDYDFKLAGVNLDVKPMIKDLLKGLGFEDGFASMNLKSIFGILNLGIDYNMISKIGKLGTLTPVKTKQVYRDTFSVVKADKESVANQLAVIVNEVLKGAGVDFNVKGQYVKVQVPAYPHDGKMDKKAVNALISGLEETIGGFVNIEDAINGALATNEMAGTAIKGIYDTVDGLLGTVNGALSSLGITIAPISPERVAEMLGEANEFKGLTAELKDIGTWDEVAFTIKNDDGEVIKQVNMGFKDGDFDGFIKTLVASLRPLVDELQKTGLLTNRTVDGETVYGLYETLIIPVFESIGIKPVATSATYTDNFNKLHSKDEKAGLDYLVNTIIKPVLTLLDRVKANPIATVMDVLPNIAYALKYNPTTAFVGNLLLGDKNLADVLNGFIGELLPGLKLNAINLDALISCGEIKEVNSMGADGGKYKTVVADKADTFVTAFYYLFDTINTGDNLKLIKDLLANIEMDAALKTVVDGLVGSLFNMTREEALCTLGATFADWTCPNAEDENGANKGTNGKTPGTGDTAISAIAVVSVLFTAGAAIVLLRKRKTIVG